MTKHILKCHAINPVNFVRGENCHLFDDQGRRYLDLESGSWAALLGHSHPRVNQVLKEQLDRVMHLGVRCPNHLAEEAAVLVLDLVGLQGGRCVFLSSGSEAVEFASMAARRATGRPLLLTFSNAYLSALGSTGQKNPADWHLVDWSAVQTQSPEEVLKSIPFERIGAFVFEPGGGSPGFMRFPPTGLVQSIARKVKEQGGLLIANEVTTGFGRTGKWFGYQHYELQPDLVAVGKGLGNGYPVSAVALRNEVAVKLEAANLIYAQSHQNNPLGCAVAIEVIKILREENWIERSAAMGVSILAAFEAMQAKGARIREARGRGMLLALELESDCEPKSTALHAALWSQGYITACYPPGHPAGCGLRMDPSLTLDEKDLKGFLGALERLLLPLDRDGC
jgi:acetylornithine/N-succinyldiaminopimelate aminotransferase